jgi:hypothetical protein
VVIFGRRNVFGVYELKLRTHIDGCSVELLIYSSWKLSCKLKYYRKLRILSSSRKLYIVKYEHVTGLDISLLQIQKPR